MVKKRAQGLSISMIVAAVIGLAVLIIIIAIFAGRVGIFGKSMASCEEKGGFCAGCPLNTDPSIRKVTCVSMKTEYAGERETTKDGGQYPCPEDHGILLRTDCNADGIEDNDRCCIPLPK